MALIYNGIFIYKETLDLNKFDPLCLLGSENLRTPLAVFLATIVVRFIVIVLNLNILLIPLVLFGVERSKYGVVPNGFINRN